MTYNLARTGANPNATIVITSRPTPIQSKAFKLLALNFDCSQYHHPVPFKKSNAAIGLCPDGSPKFGLVTED